MADFHQNQLQKFFRVCGKLMYKDRVQYVCEPQSEILAEVFGVLLCKDDPKIHPSLLCHSCYCTVMKAKAAIEDGGQYTPSVTVFTWEAHSTDHCRTCDHFESAYSGGRRKKRKHPGRPASISARTAISHIRSIAPSSFNPFTGNGAFWHHARLN